MLFMTRDEYRLLHKDFKSEPGEPPSCLKFIIGRGTTPCPVTFVKVRLERTAKLPYKNDRLNWPENVGAAASIRVVETPEQEFLTQFRFDPFPQDWIVFNTAASFDEAIKHIDDLTNIKTFAELPTYE